MHCKSRRGLTLWEVLAAGSGLALAALMGVSLLPTRTRGFECHRRSCISNVRQLATAAQMYVQDYAERLPPADYTTGSQRHTLPSFLHPYLRNGAVWSCPDASRRVDERNQFDGNSGDTTVSYGYNWLALSPNGEGIPINQVRNPDESILFAETGSYRAIPAGLRLLYAGTPPKYDHPAGCTVVHLSRRAKQFTPRKLERRASSESGQ